MFRLICLAIGYAIGCIQTAFIMGKLCKTDLSKKGSGNLGTTNALRVLGFKAGAVTFIGDILKGVVSFLVASWIFPDQAFLAGIYGCAGTILGHDFPFYLHFKGGKGIAATIGMVLCIGLTQSWQLLAVSYVIGLGAAVLTKYISVGSILFSICICASAWVFGLPMEAAVVLTALSALALWKHRSNMKRLLEGNENKFTLTKKV
ncbi:glycerol-3-phosphate 1-O-acyltransferase PlsY [Anaerotignum lactatifermentans]|uniref:Glycerol-3-phosphate acyltransferase n=1 Tax=Anaerotignum lactatifermentans TaxID=160404 RepID=A0ABS2GAP5_9FIRM|nr:glycerol-3-phosphate 1-O-acyltransferase PlsY [Anaerotignum lactatifermentans]MBM6828622.1 glycerol-3-phosphate 1-O-acyltransferase PlsY [Anaerotignum lactatifermentans]MBM6878506.1 glycerol-3-phosphate 1-O-acyltransferase PlsY [Anaerotignum lactatifermentans]MBM6950204.1 glycerol-3-phosphate 1-O-acyltransferase PlsY [Anaerotignum lactatifermentans]